MILRRCDDAQTQSGFGLSRSDCGLMQAFASSVEYIQKSLGGFRKVLI